MRKTLLDLSTYYTLTVERLNSEVERLQWRRNKVLELSSEGHSQHQIASILQIALGTVNRDVQILRQQAKKNIAKYIDETLPQDECCNDTLIIVQNQSILEIIIMIVLPYLDRFQSSLAIYLNSFLSLLPFFLFLS
jgi:hypothetical protein